MKFKELMHNNKFLWFLNTIMVTLWLLSILFMFKCYNEKVSSTKRLVDEIEYKDNMNRYNKLYYDAQFKNLKKTNRELYDSLKNCKDEIGYLLQFKYDKEYSTGVVHVQKDTLKDSVFQGIIAEPRTFEYSSEPNDTFQYKLKINSQTEPNWYSLNTKFSDKFTIVNKEDGNGLNHITIGSSTSGDISDVTVFNKKEKRKFLSRFSVGPSVTAGYDIINKQWGIMAGASVTLDLTK